MATHVFRGGALFLAEFNYSTITRAFSMDIEADALDRTAISDTTRVNIGGLRSGTWASELYYDASTIPYAGNTYESAVAIPALASDTSQAIIVSYFPGGAVTEDEGLAYFFRGRTSKMSMPWTVGEVAMFSLSGESSQLGINQGQSIVQGYLSALGVAKSASGVGTARQTGALASDRVVLMAMAGHVYNQTGTAAVQFTLQSDDNSGFTTPTNRVSSAVLSTVSDFGLELVSGAITDDYWRIIYTITGTGTVSFVASMGRIVLI